MRGALALADGTIFRGTAVGAAGMATGGIERLPDNIPAYLGSYPFEFFQIRHC